jgi:single-strand DNA-binding protein
MANGVNKQIVIGNLAKDAELTYVGEKNTPKCEVRVIANTGFGDYEHTEGFNVVIWGKRAEAVSQYLTKGTRVYVEGETRTHSWEDNAGQRRYRTEVRADELVLLGGNGRGNGGSNVPDDDIPPDDVDLDGIPF